LFNSYNVWWYILRDNNGSPAPDPSFGIVGLELGDPLFDLTCPAGSSGASEPAAARDEEDVSSDNSADDAADGQEESDC
jgi:glucan endo-1,3-beta-D-glucosidase